MLVMDFITATDEAEDGVRIDVVLERQALGEEKRLKGLDVAPGGFVVEEFGEEEHTAVIVERSD